MSAVRRTPSLRVSQLHGKSEARPYVRKMVEGVTYRVGGSQGYRASFVKMPLVRLADHILRRFAIKKGSNKVRNVIIEEEQGQTVKTYRRPRITMKHGHD